MNLGVIPLSRRAFLVSPLLACENPMVRLEDWMLMGAPERQRTARDCLRRIRELDSSIHAWVQVNPYSKAVAGPLAGIPFGVKDVIDVRGLVCELGSPLYRGRKPSKDAAVVARLKGLGAIVLGKTHTAQFAHTTPPITRNPRNLEHTPGGSSSGSAAAVAAGMAPFTLGTQTGGSVLRPASFCGVTGFKPTFGSLPVDGVLEYSKSVDTVGLFTHTPRGMLVLWDALGLRKGNEEASDFGLPDRALEGIEPPMARCLEKSIAALREHRVSSRPVPIAAMHDKLTAEARIVTTYEGARAHEERYRKYGALLQDVAKLVEEGRKISDSRFREALAHIAQARLKMAEIFKETPVLLLPAATGPAPRGLASTGDSRMNRVWTALGVPAISIPMAVGNELPLGLQLIAAPGNDSLLLNTAVQVARWIGSPAQ